MLFFQIDSGSTGSTTPTSRATLYSRLDQLDADSSDADLLSPDSALYSRVSDLDSTASAATALASSRGYTYPSNSTNPSCGSNNTYQSTRNVLQTSRNGEEIDDVHDADNNNYSGDYYNNRNNRPQYLNEDSDDFEGTLTFTNRSRSGSLTNREEDNDLNNDLEHDTLTQKRWRNSHDDDNDATDIPIVYSRRNEEEEDELRDRKKEEEEGQEEEEYIPVYTPERLRETNGRGRLQVQRGEIDGDGEEGTGATRAIIRSTWGPGIVSCE